MVERIHIIGNIQINEIPHPPRLAAHLLLGQGIGPSAASPTSPAVLHWQLLSDPVPAYSVALLRSQRVAEESLLPFPRACHGPQHLLLRGLRWTAAAAAGPVRTWVRARFSEYRVLWIELRIQQHVCYIICFTICWFTVSAWPMSLDITVNNGVTRTLHESAGSESEHERWSLRTLSECEWLVTNLCVFMCFLQFGDDLKVFWQYGHM